MSGERVPGTIVGVTDTVADAAAPESPAPDSAESAEADKPKPPPSTVLLLARHAVTAETGSMLSGRKPGIDLSDKGREQANLLGERLGGAPDRGGVREPDRAHDADGPGRRREARPRGARAPGVLEADYGDWTGGKLGDLAKEDLWRTVQRAPSRARFPEGESLGEMQVRMVAALERVVADHPGEIVVVVSHADPIKSAIAHYNGTHLDHFQRIVVSPASVTVFQLSAHGAAMVKCNDTGSLEELIPRPAEDSADGSTNESTHESKGEADT